MHTLGTRMTQPYAIRRIFYGIIALAGAALFGFGVGDAAQIDQWTEAAERLVAPLLMIITSSLAGVKANPGSDLKEPPPVVVGSAPAPVPVLPPDPQPTPTPAPKTPAGNDLLAQMREQIKANRALETGE